MAGTQDNMSDLVKAGDHDRYLTALFAPKSLRENVMAIYAFNLELARIPETVSEPMVGEIKLAWWRDAIAGLRAGEVREHPVLMALLDALNGDAASLDGCAELVEARGRDLDPAPFESIAALRSYANATGGTVQELAARVLGATEPVQLAGARKAGTAWAIVALIRAQEFRRAQGLPVFGSELDMAEIADLTAMNIPELIRPESGIVAAYLPAVLARIYLTRFRKADFDLVAVDPNLGGPGSLMRLTRAAVRREV